MQEFLIGVGHLVATPVHNVAFEMRATQGKQRQSTTSFGASLIQKCGYCTLRSKQSVFPTTMRHKLLCSVFKSLFWVSHFISVLCCVLGGKYYRNLNHKAIFAANIPQSTAACARHIAPRPLWAHGV